MIVLGSFIALLYGVGLTVNLNDHFGPLWDETTPPGPDSEWIYVWYAAFMSVIWPVYWVGRALYAIPNALMLPPGDAP